MDWIEFVLRGAEMLGYFAIGWCIGYYIVRKLL